MLRKLLLIICIGQGKRTRMFYYMVEVEGERLCHVVDSGILE